MECLYLSVYLIDSGLFLYSVESTMFARDDLHINAIFDWLHHNMPLFFKSLQMQDSNDFLFLSAMTDVIISLMQILACRSFFQIQHLICLIELAQLG